jgi:hypothetical protein
MNISCGTQASASSVQMVKVNWCNFNDMSSVFNIVLLLYEQQFPNMVDQYGQAYPLSMYSTPCELIMQATHKLVLKPASCITRFCAL